MDFTQLITLLETVSTYGDFFKGFGATLSGSADILTGSGNMMTGSATLVDAIGDTIFEGIIGGSLESALGSVDLGSASSAGSALLGAGS